MMEIKWNKGAFEKLASEMEQAINESCEVVAEKHSGDDIAVIRSALRAEFKRRFAKGAGPDDVLTNQLAERISAGE